MWVLWFSSLCSINSLMNRKWRRHLSQLNTRFLYTHKQRKLDVHSSKCKKSSHVAPRLTSTEVVSTQLSGSIHVLVSRQFI